MDIQPIAGGTELKEQTLTDNEAKIQKDFILALGSRALHVITTTEVNEKWEDLKFTLLTVFCVYHIPRKKYLPQRWRFLRGESTTERNTKEKIRLN